jgi:hypothetical protein
MSIIRMRVVVALLGGAGGLVAECAAENAIDVAAPTLSVGDRWEWVVKVGPRDSCTEGVPPNARQSESVTAVSDTGYETEISSWSGKFNRKYARDMSYDVTVKGEKIHVNPINFPIGPGSSFDSTIASGSVVTSLSCKQDGSQELMKVGAEELEVIPIVCKGRWHNRQSGNSDGATYKYWYSPVAGTAVRRTVFTYFQGRTCADLEVRLENYNKGK